MTTTERRMPTSEERAAAKEQKQKNCEAEFGFIRRHFVKVKDTKTGAGYVGKVGRVRRYDDERSERYPNSRVEVIVVFTAGQGATELSFYPSDLEDAKEPANWGK